MIARLWHGQATGTNAGAYVRHVTRTVFPSLRTIPGHRGAWLLQREDDGKTEFIALTLWESREAIEGFAGKDIDKAIVEPEARALLSEFDGSARHYDVTFKSP